VFLFQSIGAAVLTIYIYKDDSVTEWHCGFVVLPEQPTMTSRVGPLCCCLALLASAGVMSAASAKAPQEFPFTEHQRSHWAFQPVASPDIPNEGQENPIDAFVAAGMREKGLAFAPSADKVTLIRRAKFGLHGLPPTPEEVQAFLDDNSPDAFAKVVDRLLASPRYGETWARHWLDLARFAESEGFKADETRPNAWRFRDYVIDSLNADKPYDRFVQEQVAGDVLEFDDDIQRREQIVATGFLAIGPWALVDQDKVQLRMDIVDHQLDTLGRAFLGLTVGCARCHDHKFDPLPQRDYYALAGIFRSTRTLDARMSGVFSDVNRTPLPETPEELRERAEALATWDRHYRQALTEQAKAASHVEELEARVKAQEDTEADPAAIKDLNDKLGAARRKLTTAKTESGRILHYVKPVPPMALALAEEPEPENARLCLAGNPHNLGDEVPRGFLSLVPLDPNPKIANRRLIGFGFQKSSGRLELARWLTEPDNPLTARVMANRIWHWPTTITLAGRDH